MKKSYMWRKSSCIDNTKNFNLNTTTQILIIDKVSKVKLPYACYLLLIYSVLPKI